MIATHRTAWRWAVLGGVLLAPLSLGAFDEVLHRHLVYAIARENNLTREDAEVIANASWSLDINKTTTAYEGELIRSEALAVLRGSASLKDLGHARSGQLFHALTAHRDIVERSYISRLQRTSGDLTSSDPRKRRDALILLGQYLHFAGDLVVHPEDPTVGHGPEGTATDRVDIRPDRMQIAMALLNKKIQQTFAGRIEMTSQDELVRFPRMLDPADRPRDLRLRRIAGAVVDAWERPPIVNGDVDTSGAWSGRFWDVRANERVVQTGASIAAALGERVPAFKPIAFDGDGQEIGSPQAPANINDDLPFSHLALREEFREERAHSAAVALLRGAAKAGAMMAPGAGQASQLGLDIAEALADSDIRKLSAWMPPSGPGGVALNPRLRIAGDVGTPERIAFDGDTLVLVTSTGRYPFDGVSTRSFATIARAVATGQMPFITIGSEPSDRPGYAVVTYSPALLGTAEGEILHEADLQFKAIFLGLPFGAAYALNTPSDPLASGYPGPGGEFVRLWITSSGIELVLRDGRFVAEQHGMRIQSETRLWSDVRADPEMDAYTEKLTANWDGIAGRVSSFRGVELLARATAIAFWAHDRRIPIDPMILLLPPRIGLTPEYAPVAGRYSGAEGVHITGGVVLTPEDKGTTLGRTFLSQVTHLFATTDQTSDVPLAGRLIAAGYGLRTIGIAVMLPAGLLWLVARRAQRGTGPRVRIRTLATFWLVLYAVYFSLLVVASPLFLGEWLSYFDRDLIAVAVTLGGFPVLLFGLLRRGSPELRAFSSAVQARPGLRVAVLAVALLGTVAAGFFSTGVAFMTVALTGPVPTPIVNTLLTYELLPLNALSQAVTGGGAYPIPRSLAATFRPAYESRGYMPDAPAVLESTQSRDPMFPFDRLVPIEWASPVPLPKGATFYSVHGRPPF